MMELQTKEIQTIPSYEIAKMMEVEHPKVLRMIEGDKTHIGIIPTLDKAQMGSISYFIKSSYKDTMNREKLCYECTKLGCDMLANKMTGEKGILFTARYVKKFNEMEKLLLEQNTPSLTKKQELQLKLFSKDSMEVVNAHKELVELEVQEATKPLKDKIKEDEPLVAFSERILKEGDNILIRDLAKIASDEGYKTGEKRLYNKLREWNYICKTSTKPTQYAIERDYFVVETNTINTPYGTKQIFTTKVTPKAQVHIIERLMKELDNKELSLIVEDDEESE